MAFLKKLVLMKTPAKIMPTVRNFLPAKEHNLAITTVYTVATVS